MNGQYPKEIIGNKFMEGLYSSVMKSKKRTESLIEENNKLKEELVQIKATVEKHKLDIDDLKKPKGGN